MKLSVIVPTHNRQDQLADALDSLKRQDLGSGEYEIIVVDDGSSPPAVLPEGAPASGCTLLRLEGVERSAARNRGAELARTELLVFLDDDMTVGRDFLSSHLRAHCDWPSALVVGAVRLSDAVRATPLGGFRHKLETRCLPNVRGLTSIPNFCTAQNMSILKQRFFELGGFDDSIVSAEDQDLALRHTTNGGLIAFVPEADAVHHDGAIDIESYCRRAEWGMREMTPFRRRYPDWPDNVERERINGPTRLGREPLVQGLRKLVKSVLALRPIIAIVFLGARVLEHVAPNSRLLDRTYRLLLGAHLFRGYREGLKRSATCDQQSSFTDQQPQISDPLKDDADLMASRSNATYSTLRTG